MMPAISMTTGREAAKNLFFDRPAVMQLMDRATAAHHRFFGGYVRRGARQRISTRDRPVSPTGLTSRTGLLRDNIFFSLDPFRLSVVIGPVKMMPGDVPRLHEEGGTQQVRAWLWDRKTRRAIDPTKATERYENPLFIHDRSAPQFTAKYAPRPYMGPVFKAAVEKDRSSGYFWRANRSAA